MKKLLLTISLLAMSFSSLAKDITENELQGYMKALPAVVDWTKDQPALKNMNLASMLGNSESSSGGMAMSALGMIKDNDLYKQFATLTNKYGFTPEQLVSVGSEVSMAYLENIKGNLSPENKERVNQLMGGLQSAGASKGKSTSSLMGSMANSANAAPAGEAIVSENNLNLVKEYMPQLKKLFAMVQ